MSTKADPLEGAQRRKTQALLNLIVSRHIEKYIEYNIIAIILVRLYCHFQNRIEL